MKRLLAALHVLLSGPALAGSPPPGAKIFMLLGPSNMAGHDTDLANAPPDPDGGMWGPQIWRYTEKDFVQNPQHPLLNKGISAGYYFAHHYVRLNPRDNVILVRCNGAQRLKAFEPRGQQFARCVKRLERARALSGGVYSGWLLATGERDAHDKNALQTWAQDLNDIVQGLRSALGVPDLPLAFAQIGPLHCNAAEKPMRTSNWLRLRQIQAEINIPNVFMIVTEDLDGLDELNQCQHLSGKGMAEAGLRYAKVLGDAVP